MDHSQYEYTKAFVKGIPWFIDDRHIDILHSLALKMPGSSMVEIGSWRGASTSGFVEAMKIRRDLRLTIFEPNVLPELHRVISPPEVSDRIVLIQEPIYEHKKLSTVLESLGLVLIDGDHQWPALADVLTCLLYGNPVIALHDTNASPKANNTHSCWGSALTANLLRGCSTRRYWEDQQNRKGEWTHRGLLVSWPREEDWVCSALP